MSSVIISSFYLQTKPDLAVKRTYCHVYEWLETGFELVNGFIDGLHTHDLSLHFTDHWHTQTSVLSVLHSSLAFSW
jgi:hypothetical protein